jgi:hypothetical protein
MKNFYKKNSYLTETQLETLEKKFHEKYYYVPHFSELERMYLEAESFKPTFDKEEYDLYQKNIYNEEIIRKIFKFKTISASNGLYISGIKFLGLKTSKQLFIPASFNGRKVIGVFENAFYGCGFEEVFINENIKFIEKKSFFGCEGLIKVQVNGNSLIEIGEEAFLNCNQLEIFNFPSSLKFIGANCFSSTPLKKVTLPNNILTIQRGAFSNCHMIEEISIPASIVQLPESLFENCKSLKKVIFLGENLKYIGNSCFKLCTKLSQVDLPTSIKEISSYAFSECENLVVNNIPNSVTKIGIESYYRAKFILLNFSVNLIEISSGAFSMTDIDKLVIKNKLINIYNDAFKNSRITSVEFAIDEKPNSLENVPLPMINNRTLNPKLSYLNNYIDEILIAKNPIYFVFEHFSGEDHAKKGYFKLISKCEKSTLRNKFLSFKKDNYSYSYLTTGPDEKIDGICGYNAYVPGDSIEITSKAEFTYYIVEAIVSEGKYVFTAIEMQNI